MLENKLTTLVQMETSGEFWKNEFKLVIYILFFLLFFLKWKWYVFLLEILECSLAFKLLCMWALYVLTTATCNVL